MSAQSEVPRHVRHHGLMIDASFRKDGSVEYWVVERGHGRFPSLEIAKEIAEHRARRPRGALQSAGIPRNVTLGALAALPAGS